MPTPDEILSERLRRIDTIPGRFINKVNASQSELFAELIEILAQLNMSEGRVTLDLALIDELFLQYEAVLQNGRYGSLVSGFITEMQKQKGLIDEYAKIDYNAIAGTASQATYEKAEQIALRQLLGDDFKTNFINVIKDQVTASIESGASFKEMTTALRESFTDTPQRLGQISNWINQVASDRFAITDRSYSQAVGMETGLQFGQYVGGLINDSREFCVERSGHFFHINEVQAWASLEWKGKYRRTTEDNIVQWLGGYRCQHLYVLRSLASIPKIVIQRNIESGNYNPTAAERRLLNL